MMEIRFDDIDALEAAASDEFGPFGAPVHVAQTTIDAFASLTGDQQWIHVDVERCRAESPFGAPIAHGFLTLSLLPVLMRSVPVPTIVGQRAALNYGAESLRFVAPVLAGSEIAARSRIVKAASHRAGTLLTSEIAVHVVGQGRPSLVYRSQILYQR